MPTITIEVPPGSESDVERIVRVALFVAASKKLTRLLKEHEVEELVRVLEEVM